MKENSTAISEIVSSDSVGAERWSDKDGRVETSAGAGDSELLLRAKEGDGQAFSALVEPHFRQLYRVALRITRNHEDAEDVCQDSMVKAFTHINDFQGKARFSTWLMRIGMNEALMKLRKRHREARHISSDAGFFPEIPYIAQIPDKRPASDPMALFAKGEKIEILWGAINQLESKSQSAVCAYGLQDDRDSWEIANSFNLSKSGMKSRLSRAVGQLRTIVAKKLAKPTSPISEHA